MSSCNVGESAKYGGSSSSNEPHTQSEITAVTKEYFEQWVNYANIKNSDKKEEVNVQELNEVLRSGKSITCFNPMDPLRGMRPAKDIEKP